MENFVKQYHESRDNSEAQNSKRPRPASEEEPRTSKGKINVILGGSKLCVIPLAQSKNIDAMFI